MRPYWTRIMRVAVLALLIGVAGCKITSSQLGPGGESPFQSFGVETLPRR
ncbi:MAG: hypothetical protein NXI16_05090 [Alphaproteobacteria bacterium]|nr:hypothetical protein [Alphaproteobacteria bacterium]